MNNPLPVKKLLAGSQSARLIARARIQMALAGRVHELLPDPLKDHCRLLAIHDQTLVLAADSPVWASRLRFHAPQLVKQLGRNQTVRLRTFRVRVRPPERSIPDRPVKTAIPHSRNTTITLQQAAQAISDPGLKSALLRLANRQVSR